MTATRVFDDRVTAIIVNYRTPELALECAAAVARERAALPNLRIMLVDGGSGDGSAEKLAAGIADASHADCVTLLPLAFNGGFGWANNQAIRRALQQAEPAEFVFLVNPDAIIDPGALALLVEAMRAEPRAASAGSLLIGPLGWPVGSAFEFPTVASEFFRGANTPLLQRLAGVRVGTVEAEATQEVEWVTGASVLLRATALRECGLFDEGFFLYFEEVELMHRLGVAGWKALHVPASRVRHLGGASTGVVDGSSTQSRLPAYWFQSRRRYFSRVHGPAKARLAAVAWAAGYSIWRVRELVGLGRRSAHAPHELRDLWRTGIGATAFDRQQAVARWDGPLDELPAWAARA
ncbi:MAG TPA: glycosyltransferase family 2 protein [Sphingomonas sp.]|nr:glycosyltransferase family 2 protein [Sphingomonas sp.]